MSSFARLAVDQRLRDGLPMPSSWVEMGINSASLPDQPTHSEYERFAEYLDARDSARARGDATSEGTPAQLSFSDIGVPR